MGLLSDVFAHLENQRGRIKRRGLLDVFASNLGEIADTNLAASEKMASVVPEVKQAGREKMTESALGLLGAIKAYHGSPHKFDKFDMSKIGTGEGAQAYGHGLYFAESPSVALNYKKQLSDGSVYINGQLQKKDLTKAATVEDLALNAMHTWGDKGPSGAAGMMRDAVKAGDVRAMGESDDLWLRAADWLDTNARNVEAKTGELYETSLRWPDPVREASDPLGPQHFLDWDKPLSQQPESVKALPAIKRLLAEEAAYKARYPSGGVGERLGANVLTTVREKELKSQGLPGIRYLDAGSRGAGEGTANYVVFDDALVEILKRNGMAP